MKGLFILYGESFRNYSKVAGLNRAKDGEGSVQLQKEASTSHMDLLNSLTAYNVDILINTYDTKYKNELLSFYKDPIHANFMDKNSCKEHRAANTEIVVDQAIQVAKENVNISMYDFIFICRLDLLLKPKLIENFLPIKDKIIYPNVMSIVDNKFRMHQKGNFCISDVFCIIPKKYYHILEEKQIVRHGAIHGLHKLNLHIDKDIDFFSYNLYVANTIQQKNPFYKIINRPEGPEEFRDWHTKKFNKKLLKLEPINSN